MNYAIKILTAKKREINQEIDRVVKIDYYIEGYKEDFNKSKQADLKLMNDKLKQITRSLNVLNEFNT